MAFILMAFIVTAYIVMAYIVMAYIVLAYVVMNRSIESSNDLTVGGIVERIKNQEQRFKAKFAKKI